MGSYPLRESGLDSFLTAVETAALRRYPLRDGMLDGSSSLVVTIAYVVIIVRGLCLGSLSADPGIQKSLKLFGKISAYLCLQRPDSAGFCSSSGEMCFPTAVTESEDLLIQIVVTEILS